MHQQFGGTHTQKKGRHGTSKLHTHTHTHSLNRNSEREEKNSTQLFMCTARAAVEMANVETKTE